MADPTTAPENPLSESLVFFVSRLACAFTLNLCLFPTLPDPEAFPGAKPALVLVTVLILGYEEHVANR